MARNFLDQNPPRVDWDKLRQEPTAVDLEAIPPASAEEWEKDGMAIAGTPDKVLAEIESQTGELGINYLLTYLFFGNLTLEQAMRSLKLFSTEIMPKLEKL